MQLPLDGALVTTPICTTRVECTSGKKVTSAARGIERAISMGEETSGLEFLTASTKYSVGIFPADYVRELSMSDEDDE